MNYLVVSSSLSPKSRSRILAREAFELLKKAGADCEYIDLCDLILPLCDGGESYNHPSVKLCCSKIFQAKGILVATPIYNYSINSALKNLVELTGENWKEKVVGFLCAAGGQGSYMSIMGFANSLMLDFRCVIIPRFLYTTGAAFKNGELVDDKIRERFQELTDTLIKFTIQLNSPITFSRPLSV